MEFSLPCTGRSKFVCSLYLTQWAKPEGSGELPPGSLKDDLIASLGLEVKHLPVWSIVQIPDTSVPWKCLCSGRECEGKILSSVIAPFGTFAQSLIRSQASHLAFDLHQWQARFTTSAFLLSPGCPDHEWPLPYFLGGTADDPHGGLCAHLSECMVPSLGRHHGKLE